jgi:hypothetical protein
MQAGTETKLYACYRIKNEDKAYILDVQNPLQKQLPIVTVGRYSFEDTELQIVNNNTNGNALLYVKDEYGD